MITGNLYLVYANYVIEVIPNELLLILNRLPMSRRRVGNRLGYQQA